MEYARMRSQLFARNARFLNMRDKPIPSGGSLISNQAILGSRAKYPTQQYERGQFQPYRNISL